MKKLLVIGNPINHSLSPKLHNYWIKKNNINAVYEKKKLEFKDLENLIIKIKKQEIYGANVTIPFKKDVIPFMDNLSEESRITQSVNTIYLKEGKITGHNTDVSGFELAIKKTKYDLNKKKVLILGSGGVVPSLIFTLKKMKVSKIFVSNRTQKKAEKLQELFQDLTIIKWGNVIEFDMVINATSLGLNSEDKINLNFSNVGKGKFFYDVIYNPKETNFLKIGKKLGNKIENGKLMFIHQASASFKIWHDIDPKIDDEVIRLLD